MTTLNLEDIELLSGYHSTREAGVCALELVAWMADEPHSDHPSCVCPVFADFVRLWNDRFDDETRQKLKPYLSKMIGTAKDGFQEQRAWMLIDWSIREAYPIVLDLLKLKNSANRLRDIPALRDIAGLKSARPVLAEVKKGVEAFNPEFYTLALDLARALTRTLDLARALARALTRTLDLDQSVFGLIERFASVGISVNVERTQPTPEDKP